VLLRHCHTDDARCTARPCRSCSSRRRPQLHRRRDHLCRRAHVVRSASNTAIAVAAHEIPQEVGDVAILLAAGYSRGGALLLNLVSGASGLLGAMLAYAAVGVVPESARSSCVFIASLL